MSENTDPEEIVEEIKGDFHTYLRKGVRLDSVVGDVHPDLDIADVESLLRVHFLLTSGDTGERSVGVIDFVDQLPHRVRRLKTTTTGRRESIRGEIRGAVDPHETLKRRSQTGQLNEPLFVCLQREEHYDIEENLVLKRLLTVIRGILQDDLKPMLEDPEGYDWLEYWTTPSDTQKGELPHEWLLQMYRENVYLQRISAADSEVTARMIESVKRSRSPLYREAAVLLDRYRRLMRRELTDQEAREVLNNTMIAPAVTETLFELYWIFRLLDTFEDVEFRVIRDQNPSVIASWETDGSKYTLYHNATGDQSRFREELRDTPAAEDAYLLRMQEVLRTWQDLKGQLLDLGGSDTLWGGRPDIVLEKTNVDESGAWELDQVFVGEVKYTTNPDYAAAGLRELLEYMAFVRRKSDDHYVESVDNVLGSHDVRGLLFVDQLKTYSDGESDIDIVQFGDDVPSVV
jgi:hypothetical protein